jgi:hypothetical protein
MNIHAHTICVHREESDFLTKGLCHGPPPEVPLLPTAQEVRVRRGH